MYYTFQPIAVYTAQEMQGFRKGNCSPYENRVLANGSGYKFTNIMLKRLTTGGTATVKLYTLDDVEAATLTPPGQTNYTLDDGVDAYEMLVLHAGNWTALVSLNDGFYYLEIQSGSNTWYSDAIYIEQNGGEAFPLCGGDWVKVTWTDGRYIQADVSTDGVTPVMAYPDASHTFFTFLLANLSQPDWAYEQEGEEDAAKVFVPSKRSLAKKWALEGFPVSESMVDALRASALFETVAIDFPNSSGFTNLREIEIEHTWLQGGCFAQYKYIFTTEFLLKQGCCP